MTTNTHSSQAGLASFRPTLADLPRGEHFTGTPAPLTIYAAIIEWGDEEAPSLFAARSEAAVLADVRIATGEDLPEARTLAEYQKAYHESDGGHWMSIYEMEV